MLRSDAVPESYVSTDEVRETRTLVRGRQTVVGNQIKYAHKIHSSSLTTVS